MPAATPPPVDKPVAAAPKTGNLIASSIPWAYVWIDGKETRRSTPVSESHPIKLKPGEHKVTFFKDGQKFTYQVTLTAGKTTSLVKKLELNK